MTRYIPAAFAIAAVLVALGGCDDRDPYLRTDVWQPTGANAANIAAMVANKNDLIRGRSTSVEDVKAPELSVEHIWTDQPKHLLGGSSGGGGSGGGSGSGGGGGGGNGGGSGGGGSGGGGGGGG